MKNKKQMLITMAISVMIIIISAISLIANKKELVHTAKLDAETLRTMQYEQLEDNEMFADNCQYVKFGAFFTKNLDSDEDAERILGSCNEIGNSDTLYMDLNILSNGYLKDGKITIGSKNFTYKMQMVKDSVLKKDYVSNNVKEIELNTVNAGTQKLIMGTIHASIASPNSYTQVNTITLTGTHVADDGTETPIKKSINITADWYGTASASLSGLITDYEPTDFSDAENVTVKFSYKMKETEKSLIPTKTVMQATIPDLLGFNPTAVTCDIPTSDYNYDSENKIIYIENNTKANENIYNVTVTYPKEAVETLIARFNEENLVRLTSDATGYIECFNNKNMNFENPYVTDTVSSTASVTIQVKGNVEASHLVDVSILNTSYVSYPAKGYAMSKEDLLEAYDSEQEKDVTYTVEWSVYRQKEEVGKTTLVLRDRFAEGDLFDNTYIEEYVNNVGLYFSQTELIPEDGTIYIYNDQSNELVKEFKNGEWKNYTKATPFYFDTPIKDIRIETTEDKQSKEHFNVYNIRKIDIKKLKEKYTREQVEDIAQLKTHLTVSGSNIVNDFTVKDEINLVIAKSYNEISINPTYIATSEINPIDATIKISVPTHNVANAQWQNGIFLVEMPSKIIYMNLEDVTIDSNSVAIDGYELYKENNKYYIKIVTSNEKPESSFNITLKSKILADPMAATTYETVNLYSYNEYCKMYYNSTADVLDINGNEDKSEVIRIAATGLQITAPSSFVTVETVSNYNDKGEITIAPNIAEVTRGTREATINVDFANNYEENVSNVEILGKIPFKGNTYINGNSLNSEYSVQMTEGGIKVPDELKDAVKVYYSENENPTKDLSNTSNGWKAAKDITSFENIKTYLIVINNYDLLRGKKYSFNYTVTIPQDVTFNKASYACHTVYFKINTAGGTLDSSVQPNKVGIRIVRYFDFDSLKYKDGTTLGVSGAKYSMSEIDEEGNEVNSRIIISGLDGKLYLNDLKVNQTYIFKEIQAPENYELNTNIIKFKVNENSNKELEFELLSESSFNSNVKFEKDENGKDVFRAIVYDLPKLSLNINKIDKDTKNPIQGVIFEIDGKTYVTDSKGQVKIENLSLGKEYTLKENYADDYYIKGPITFSVSKNGNNEFIITSNDEKFNNSKITNDDKNPLIQLNATIENEKIATYKLQIIKVDENNNESKLEGAKFLLRKEDEGNSIYYTTNKDGIIDISNLYQYVEGKSLTGKYTLQEVESPNGYITNKEKIVFVVSKDNEGKLQMNIENKDSLETVKNIESDSENVKLTIQNKAMFKITKIDSETKAPLANAEFIIYELKEDGTILDFAKNVDNEYIGTINKDGNYVVVSDENGVITAALGNGIYKLVESKAPKGYDQNLRSEVFTIVGNKEIDSKEDDEIELPEMEGSQEITNTIEISKIEDLVKLSKDVQNGNDYKGVAFKLKETLDFNNDNSYKNPNDNQGFGDINGDGKETGIKDELTNTEGKGFLPIGTYDNYFNGTFDGQGNEIQNIYINREENVGLFGHLRDAKIINVGVTGVINGHGNVGGICGLSTGNVCIENCYNKCEITGYKANGNDAFFVGGIVGEHQNSNLYIKSCNNYGNINNSYQIGGIVGQINEDDATIVIYNSNNYGNIVSKGESVGGIIGQIFGESTIYLIKCNNEGNIVASNEFAGLIGEAHDCTIEIKKCSNKGDLNTDNTNAYCGGFGGYIYDVNLKIYDSYNSGNITGGQIVGGLVGNKMVNNCIIENSYNTGKITTGTNNGSAYSVGGLVGDCDTAEIKSCYNTGNIQVNAAGFVGGIAGTVAGSIDNCYNIADITVKEENASYIYAGGIVGSSEASISNSFNTGKIEGSSNIASVNMGGIAGYSSKDILYTYNLNDVIFNSGRDVNSSYTYIGGIVGTGASVNYSYNAGNVVNNKTGNSHYVGGICGNALKINYCYNTGNVTNSVDNTNITSTNNSIYVYVSGIGQSNETSFCYNIGNIKNTIKSKDNSYAYIYVAGINANGSATDCYNKGNIENYSNIDVVSYTMDVAVGGIIGGENLVSSSYNTGSIYNNVIGTAKTEKISTGAISGNANSTGENNYYSSNIDVIGKNVSTENQTEVADEYMKTEEFYSKLSSGKSVWKYNKNNYPELEIPILTKTEKAITQITLENQKSNYEITTEILPDENGSYNGGTISGEYTDKYLDIQYKKLVETLKYGQNSTKEIKITPNTGYQISKVAINNEEISVEANSEGVIVIPAGYFREVDKNYNVAVTFALKENLVTINKVNEKGDSLEGALFNIEQIETRPEISDEVKPFVSTSTEYSYIDTSKSANNLIGEFTNIGTYYFEKQDDGSYVSNNKGIKNSRAESYVKIDLTGKTGTYYIVTDASVRSSSSSQGVAIVTKDTEPVTTYQNAFINTSNSENTRYTQKINGGEVYYLHFIYIKGNRATYNEDIFEIHSLNLYEEAKNKFEFEKDGEKYVSKFTERYNISTTAKGYIPIDLKGKTGKYNLTINAEMKGNSYQSSYIQITKPEATNALETIQYISDAKDYKITLDGGYEYNIVLSHTNNYGKGEIVDNVFTINSIKLELNSEGFYSETNAKTNEKGQILRGLKYGTYKITEIKAPEGHVLNKDPVTFVVGDNTEKEIRIVNESEKMVTTHYYLKGTGPEFNNEPVQVAEDIVEKIAKGKEYTTTPQITIDKYTLIKNEKGEYIIPENASGYVGDENIDVYYYYEEITYKYTVNYFYDGVKDESKTDILTATPNAVISKYEEKLKEGYALDKVENFPLTVGVEESENIINVYYVSLLNITTEIIKHNEKYTDGTEQKDVTGGFVTGADTKEPLEVVQIGGTSTKEIKVDPNDGYEIVKILINNTEFDFKDKLDNDGNVTFEPGYFKAMTESKHIKVEFRKRTSVIVKYLEKDTEKVVATEETISGIEGDKFRTVSKEVEGYHKATPEITNKDKVEIKPDGNMFADTLTVIYWYEVDESQIIERFIEITKDGKTKEIESEKHTGAVNTDLTSKRKVYDLYKSVDGPGSSNSNVHIAGKDENSKVVKFEANKVKEIWYYYTKKTSDLTVEYVDNITNQPIIPSVTITQEVGTKYPNVRKEFAGYKLDIDRLPENENGHFTEEGDTIKYYYIELKKYDIEVVYTVDSVPVNGVKLNIEGTNGTRVNDYITNGSLYVDKIESTDIGTEKYTLYEVETPNVYKPVLSKDKPGEVTLIKRFNEETRRYEVVAEWNDIEGLRTVVNHENKKVTIYIETISKYDLSLKKFISKIDDVKIEGRAPIITLDNNGKPTYKMNDKIEEVSNNQNITYTIRMYNESEITAKGKRVIEYIPDGLVFMPENETNIKYQWVMFGRDENNELFITEDVNKAIIVVTDYLVDKEIGAFDRQSIPNSLDVEAVFKVDETKLTSEDRIIENKVQIMPNKNDDYPGNDESTEKVYVKYFDLSIEKYIEEITIENKNGKTTNKYGNNQNGNPVKIDIKKSEVNDTVLTITYGLIIKNVGQIPGYATEIVDYTPENFVLVEDGKWIIDGKIAKSTSLSNILLQPGESTVLKVTYEWKLSETNIGTRINEAEITKYANDYDAVDVTDDNKDNEVLIVTLKTGLDEVAHIVIPVMGAIIIIAAGVVVIKKKY